jgi:serine/threonine-protein kinase RsbW
MADVHAEEQIRLTVPAGAEYARIARITTAGVATRLGFSIDDVEQLKLAVGEVWSVVVGEQGWAGSLTLTYDVEPGALDVDVDAVGPCPALDPTSVELAAKLLHEVVDDHVLSADGHAHLRKLRRPRSRH